MKKNKEKFWQFRKKLYLCIRNRERCPPKEEEQAEIAQLVEHNLAKVGVAGPSPVFRSQIEQKERLGKALIRKAQVAELVDAHVSGACAARRAGSSPVLGTLFSSHVIQQT